MEKHRGRAISGVVVEEGEALTPDPWVLVVDRSPLHLIDRNSGTETLASASRRVVPSVQRILDCGAGVGTQHGQECYVCAWPDCGG